MWIAFDSITKSVIRKLDYDSPARQGATDSFNIFAYFDGIEHLNGSYVATISFEYPDGSIGEITYIMDYVSSNKFDVSRATPISGTSTSPFVDGESYKGFSFTPDVPGILGMAGTYSATINVYHDDTKVVNGTFTFYVEPTANLEEYSISDTQFDELMEAMADISGSDIKTISIDNVEILPEDGNVDLPVYTKTAADATFATEADFNAAKSELKDMIEARVQTWILSYDETIATVKENCQVVSTIKFLVLNSSGEFEDKTAELLNGDYDNLTIVNIIFSSSNQTVAWAAGYLIFKNIGYAAGPSRDSGLEFYLIDRANFGLVSGPVGSNIYVTNTDVPDRWISNIRSSGAPTIFSALESKSNLANYVDLTNPQTISGVKTIDSSLKFEDNGNITQISQDSTELKITVDPINGSTIYFTSGGNIYGDGNGDLGTSSSTWDNVYLSGNLSDGTNSITVANIQHKLTAGTAIDITNNTISADTDILATHLYVAENYATVGSVSDIEELIPAQATSENKLADKDFVNSSIATNTANFLGTYNIVDDLGLTTSATHAQVAAALESYFNSQSINPTNNDYVFVAYPNATVSTEYDQFDRYKYSDVDTDWVYEYTLNNSSFTAAQWAAINSGITSSMIDDFMTLSTDQTATGTKTFNNIKTNTIDSVAGNLVLKYLTATKFQIGSSNLTASANVRPEADNTYDLGLSGYGWKDLYLSGKVDFGNNTKIQKDSGGRINLLYNNRIAMKIGNSGSSYMAINLTPDSPNTYDLGTSSLKWKDLYLSDNLTDGTNSVTVADIANGIINVINAADIVSNTLTQEQLDTFTNGKITIVKGTLLGNTDCYYFPATQNGTYYDGFIINFTNGLAYFMMYRINSSKVISLLPSINNIRLYSIQYFNGKLVPAYPSNTGTFTLKCVNGNLTWVADLPGISYVETPVLIEFIISKSGLANYYSAVPGMTWADWCNSQYNIDNWHIDPVSNYIYDSTDSVMVTSQSASDLIVADTTYTTQGGTN